jgi:hypothetical protein
VGFLHDQTGGYVAPFTVTAALTYAAAVAILFARPSRAPGGARRRVELPQPLPGSATVD